MKITFRIQRKLMHLSHRAGQILSRLNGYVPGYVLFRNCVNHFLGGLNNVNWDFQKNGEQRVVALIQKHLQPKTVFDVGANVGQWATMARKAFPQAAIHSFEIVPSTFEQFEKNTATFENITRNNIGLSDVVGPLTISLSATNTQDATAYVIDELQRHTTEYISQVSCQTTTGAIYMAQNKLQAIDFLKIDVEGSDFKALLGFAEYLDNVKVIQFEYGVFNVQSRGLLQDFFKTLSQHNFVIGKIYPHRVEFFSYDPAFEDFRGNNYIAVKKDNTTLIRLLETTKGIR